MSERTIRELAGEIWAELEQESRNANIHGSPIRSIHVDTMNRIIDVIMGVLARHENTLLVNDKDMPVMPLRRDFHE